MKLEPWEATIQQIADEAIQQPNERLIDALLLAWRRKLATEPTSLVLHHVDQMMREVRKRITVASQ